MQITQTDLDMLNNSNAAELPLYKIMKICKTYSLAVTHKNGKAIFERVKSMCEVNVKC